MAKETLYNWKHRLRGAQEKLLRLQCQHPTPHNLQEEQRMQYIISHIQESDTMRWRQKSRAKWNLEGEKNTNFFHLYTMIRRRKNRISWIQKLDGSVNKLQEEIKETLKAHFQQALTSSPTSPLPPYIPIKHLHLQPNEITYLTQIPDQTEITHLLKHMPPMKAPGPDGYTRSFYQRHWDNLKEDVFELVRNFFSNNTIPFNLNHTYIALIPKKDECITPSDYRPISLTNTLYKLIAKLLAGRLRAFLPRLISREQATFIHGRNIKDNIVLAREI